jgi:hypothetical protein
MIDTAFEQLRRANPVPDPTATRRRSAEDIRRTIDDGSTVMAIDTKTPVAAAAQAGRKWVAAAVAATVTFVIVGAPMLLGAGPAGWTDLFAPDPTEIGLAYMEAREERDLERMLDLLADDVEFVDVPFVQGRDQLPGLFKFLDILGSEFADPSCREIGLDSGIVQCRYLFDSPLSDPVGLGQFVGSFILMVDDGKITRVVHSFNFGWSPAWDALMAWMDEQDPTAKERLLTRVQVETHTIDTPLLTDVALDEFASFVNAYLAEQG